MNMPGMVGEASVYQTSKAYRFTSKAAFPSSRSASIIPQDCGTFKEILCFPYVTLATTLCSGPCTTCYLSAGSNLPSCAACVACMLASGGMLGPLPYLACHDCLPVSITTVVDQARSGGGGGPPPPDCTTTGCRPGLVCCDCVSPAPCTTQARCNQLCQL
jgi:hypothetical protein